MLRKPGRKSRQADNVCFSRLQWTLESGSNDLLLSVTRASEATRIWELSMRIVMVNIFVCVLATVASAQPGWMNLSNEDRITGQKSTSTVLPASDTVLYPRRELRSGAGLFVSCKGRRLTVFYAISDTLIGGRLPITVDYRFGDERPVKSEAWRASSSGFSIGLWDTKSASIFARALMRHKTLALRTSTDVFGVTEATFNLEGAIDAIRPVLAACRIKAD